MKTFLQTLLIAIGISVVMVIVIFTSVYMVQSITRDEVRNSKWHECQKVAEDNKLGEEFIQTCMN